MMSDEMSAASKSPKDFPLYAPGESVAGPTMGLLEDPIGYHLEAYRQFGPTYRTTFWGEESLCLSGLEANEFIWRNSDLWNYSLTRASFREEFGEDYLTQLDGRRHKKKRVRLNPSFRPDFLMSGSPQMNAVVLEDVEKVVGQIVDLRQVCYRLLLHMTSKGLLGLEVPEAAEKAILQVEHDLLFAGLTGPARRSWFERPIYQQAKVVVVEYLGSIVDEWTAQPEKAPEMYKLGTKVPEGEPPLSREELTGDLYLLLTGGLNSTANLILWTLMQVYHRPDWLAQLQAEVEAVPPAQFTAMKQWPKIKATIQEIERLRPATPVNVLIPAADFEYQGIAFKKGEPVTHFLVLPHFLPEIYEQPAGFRPERFLGDTAYPAKAQATFGGGAHMCIGMPLARLQSPLILANIVLNYEIAFMKKPSFRAKLAAALTPADDRIEVKIERRKKIES
jgi:cytochrome P450